MSLKNKHLGGHLPALLRRPIPFCYSDSFVMRFGAQLRALVLAATIATCAFFAACAAPNPPLPPSLELPKPPSDLQASRKGDNVTLTWTAPTETTDGGGIRQLGPTLICRTAEPKMSECGTPVHVAATVQIVSTVKRPDGTTRTIATFTDVLPQELQRDPKALVTYAIEALNTQSRGASISNTAGVPAASTLPPPQDVQASLTGDGVVLHWTGILHQHVTPEMRHIYRVYRQEEGKTEKELVGEVQLTTDPAAELTDRWLEWEKTYNYTVAAVTYVSLGMHPCPNAPAPQAGQPVPDCATDLQVEGDDSQPAKVVAHDVFPPAVPTGVQAVFSGAGQQPFIDLTWNVNNESDLAGYNIYRHEAGSEPVKINTDLARSPAFRDASVASGKTYLYSVSAVDVRGNESARSEETSEGVP